LIKLRGSRGHPRRNATLLIDLEFIMLQFLFRLTISLSGAAALVGLLIPLLTYFFPDPTRANWQSGQDSKLATVILRTTPREMPVGRPTQAPAGTQGISQQTTSPAANIRSLSPSEGIPGPSAEQGIAARSNADASEQQQRLPETSPESARVLPVVIDNRSAPTQELPQVAQGALSEENERAGAVRASVISQSGSNRSVAFQNDNSTVAAPAAGGDTKIAPAGQTPSSVPIQKGRPAAVESSNPGLGEQQQSMTRGNLDRSKLSVAKRISIHYRRQSAPARADAQRLASWLASSGFGSPRLQTTGGGVASPVVRYFFKEDAGGVDLLVNALRSRDGNWRAEDCRSYRHKPPAGTIEVWPHG
jgi:hypothetical protein